MTLTLTVRGGEGEERAAPHTMAIDETATIGRAPECTLVLGDAQRGISRIQARIERRGDTYVLVDAGSNPTLLNDEALGAGREAVLSNDDRIGIGAYTLVVSVETVFAVDQTLMTQPAPSAPVLCADLPATPEFEAPPPAPLIPDDWNAPHDRTASHAGPGDDDAPFTPDPLAATPLLREPGDFGGDASQALMDALSGADPLRDASVPRAPRVEAVVRSLEHVSPERVMSALPAVQSPSQPDAIPPAEERQMRDAPPSASKDDEAALLDALLDGLGVERADVAHIAAPDLARLIGSMLRTATQGAMSVLRSRAMTKRETRMAMTMIEERDNNPLKFFPDADRALTQMLGARGRGYLAPDEAMRAAFHDIQTHELALIAGMRAALDDAMARMEPAAIERSLDAPGRFHAIVGNRKARLWQRYVKTWERVSRDTGDDFQQRFGEPFGRAYQAQLDALQSPKD
ncbi:type VI secretion system-associated FHA domain protein TagH [Caballeronia sp. AZ7_KS35]|uniref:type VI secretion system-associated FHA domain protein TagH n=1 Tax=Caballeronia sp. AZ7_KS35 TaxID=2921762 RepID=UPI002028E05B|nr:type VI secretion system-associated FHA domain protein TagH [Caballeronia sp. AZ7_KS35]